MEFDFRLSRSAGFLHFAGVSGQRTRIFIELLLNSRIEYKQFLFVAILATLHEFVVMEWAV